MTTVTVIGLGAVGASYAARMVETSPEVRLRVLASGDRAERLRRDGVTVNGVHHRFAVVEPGHHVEPADVVVVATKCHDLPEVVDQLAEHVGPGTTILSLLNGITSEARLAEAFPMAYVPLAVCVGIDAVRLGGDVRYTTLGWVELGDRVAGEPSPRLVQLEHLLTDLGVVCKVRADMVRGLWWKFLVNVGVNQVTALLEAPYAIVQRPGPGRELVVAAQREVVAVAEAEGVDLTEADIATFLDVMMTLGPDNYTSMAQDAMAHRRTEVDEFAGAVVRLGESHGIPTPVNRVLLQAFLAKHELWGVGGHASEKI